MPVNHHATTQDQTTGHDGRGAGSPGAETSFPTTRRHAHNQNGAAVPTNENPTTAVTAGEFHLGGDLRVTRLGLGAMRLALGGQVREPAAGIAILRRAVDLRRRHQATAAQVALAWLITTSPVTLAIPDTSPLDHLIENITAAGLRLTADDLAELAGQGSPLPPGA